MLKIMSTACAALIALTAPLATPAMAMPLPAKPALEGGHVIKVQEEMYRNWERYGNDWRRGERSRDWRPRYERRGNDAYWRGHRGYREYRPGYRRHGDFWFPPAAFIAGAIIGGAIANQPPPPPRYYGGNAHVEWCYARYRSYRASDNTFQPYNGPRRQCASPYG